MRCSPGVSVCKAPHGRCSAVLTLRVEMRVAAGGRRERSGRRSSGSVGQGRREFCSGSRRQLMAHLSQPPAHPAQFQPTALRPPRV